MADIAIVIRSEHARIRRLFDELAVAQKDASPDGPADELGQAWLILAALLETHLDAVEEICYLPLCTVSPDSGRAISQAVADGADLREILRETELHRPGSRPWLLAVRAATEAALSQLGCVETALAEYARRAAGPGRSAPAVDGLQPGPGRAAVAPSRPERSSMD